MSRLPRTRVFDLPCRFGDREGTVRVYLGQPADGFQPLHFQRMWLLESRNGSLDPAAAEAVNELFGQLPTSGGDPEKTPTA